MIKSTVIALGAVLAVASPSIAHAGDGDIRQDNRETRPDKQELRKDIQERTQEYRFASYIEDWRIKVEKVGSLNYPEAAKQQRIYGRLQLTVSIKADGSVEKVDINRSSGHEVLDAAAIRIVELAGPYAPLPPRYPQGHRHPWHHPYLDIHPRRPTGERVGWRACPVHDASQYRFYCLAAALNARMAGTIGQPGEFV